MIAFVGLMWCDVEGWETDKATGIRVGVEGGVEVGGRSHGQPGRLPGGSGIRVS